MGLLWDLEAGVRTIGRSESPAGATSSSLLTTKTTVPGGALASLLIVHEISDTALTQAEQPNGWVPGDARRCTVLPACRAGRVRAACVERMLNSETVSMSVVCRRALPARDDGKRGGHRAPGVQHWTVGLNVRSRLNVANGRSRRQFALVERVWLMQSDFVPERAQFCSACTHAAHFV
jgi:hypothetical protein